MHHNLFVRTFFSKERKKEKKKTIYRPEEYASCLLRENTAVL